MALLKFVGFYQFVLCFGAQLDFRICSLFSSFPMSKEWVPLKEEKEKVEMANKSQDNWRKSIEIEIYVLGNIEQFDARHYSSEFICKKEFVLQQSKHKMLSRRGAFSDLSCLSIKCPCKVYSSLNFSKSCNLT